MPVACDKTCSFGNEPLLHDIDMNLGRYSTALTLPPLRPRSSSSSLSSSVAYNHPAQVHCMTRASATHRLPLLSCTARAHCLPPNFCIPPIRSVVSLPILLDPSRGIFSGILIVHLLSLALTTCPRYARSFFSFQPVTNQLAYNRIPCCG